MHDPGVDDQGAGDERGPGFGQTNHDRATITLGLAFSGALDPHLVLRVRSQVEQHVELVDAGSPSAGLRLEGHEACVSA